MEFDPFAELEDVSFVVRTLVADRKVRLDLHVGRPAEQTRIDQPREIVGREGRDGGGIKSYRIGVCPDRQSSARNGSFRGAAGGSREGRAEKHRATHEPQAKQAAAGEVVDVYGSGWAR